MSYDNTNRGSIWKNDRKEKDTHADFAGSINIDGVEYWLNGWKRKPDAHPKAPAMSFTVKRKEVQPDAQPTTQQDQGFRDKPATQSDFADDEIPF